MHVITIIRVSILSISIILLVSSCIRLRRWRRSAFCAVNAYCHEDDEVQLPSKIKIYYNRTNPKIMYRERTVPSGVICPIVSIVLGAILLFAVIASCIW